MTVPTVPARTPAQLVRFARVAGLLYVLQMATGVFAQLYARGSLVVRGDAAATAQRILEHESLFRLGIVSDLATYGMVLALTWMLWVLLRPIDRDLAMLAVVFRLVELAVHVDATVNSVAVLRLVGGPPYLDAVGDPALQALALLAISLQGAAVNTGFVFLGIGSAVFAWLFLKSGYVPRWLALVGVSASLLLSAFALAIILVPSVSRYGMLPMLPMGVYEVGIGLWMLARGVRLDSSTHPI